MSCEIGIRRGGVEIQNCLLRQAFINTARWQEQLEDQFNKVINDIKRILYPHAQLVKKSGQFWLPAMHDGRPNRYIPPEVRIAEIDQAELKAKLQLHDLETTIRGHYDPDSAKILLSRDLWCKKTLIHESLHALSFFALETELEPKLHELIEGLTEFFCGFVMFNQYHDCYNAWRQGEYPFCSAFSDYFYVVKTLAAFCRIIPIISLIGVYFWDGTEDWWKHYDTFIDRIRSSGYPRFQDFARASGLRIHERLLEACTKSFGAKFRNALQIRPAELLDFTKMRLY